MEKYYTAVTYKNWERVGEPFSNDKGKLYTKVKQKCDRCTNGIYAIGVENGHIKPHPAYNGVCLKCNGVGYIVETVRLYTEKEFNSIEKQKERAAERDKFTTITQQYRIDGAPYFFATLTGNGIWVVGDPMTFEVAFSMAIQGENVGSGEEVVQARMGRGNDSTPFVPLGKSQWLGHTDHVRGIGRAAREPSATC